MNIQIKGETQDESVKVNISNESFNNYNYVSISWLENEGTEDEEYKEIELGVDDLYRAIELFNNIRKENEY